MTVVSAEDCNMALRAIVQLINWNTFQILMKASIDLRLTQIRRERNRIFWLLFRYQYFISMKSNAVLTQNKQVNNLYKIKTENRVGLFFCHGHKAILGVEVNVDYIDRN